MPGLQPHPHLPRALPSSAVNRRFGPYYLRHEPAGSAPPSTAETAFWGLSLTEAPETLGIGPITARRSPDCAVTSIVTDTPEPWLRLCDERRLPPRQGAERLIAHLVCDLVDLSATLEPQHAIAVSDTLFMLARGLVSGAEPDVAPAIDDPLSRAIRLIDSQLLDPDLDAARLGAALGLSRASLYRLFRDRGGVNAYLRERRLHNARDILARRTGRHPTVAEVAQTHGFSNVSYFSRAFRAAFGQSPGGLPRSGTPGALKENS